MRWTRRCSSSLHDSAVFSRRTAVPPLSRLLLLLLLLLAGPVAAASAGSRDLWRFRPVAGCAQICWGRCSASFSPSSSLRDITHGWKPDCRAVWWWSNPNCLIRMVDAAELRDCRKEEKRTGIFGAVLTLSLFSKREIRRQDYRRGNNRARPATTLLACHRGSSERAACEPEQAGVSVSHACCR